MTIWGQDRPTTRKIDQVDNYHGVRVEDPYRWLEDDQSAETKAWVEMQNRYTGAYLNSLPGREAMQKRLREVMNYPKLGMPIERGEYIYFSRNDGLQNQSVWYWQKGANAKPEVLLDPNQLSKDGTVALGMMSFSRDGRYLAYGISRGGSDWREVQVMDLTTRKLLPEKLEWLKFTELSWAGNGFFYSRFPKPDAGKELTTGVNLHSVYFHKVGTPQSSDELIFEDRQRTRRYHNLETNSEETMASLTVFDASAGTKGTALFLMDLKTPSRKFIPVEANVTDDNFGFIAKVGNKALILTTRKAPRGQILSFDLKTGSFDNKPVIAEGKNAIESAFIIGGKLFLTQTEDVLSRMLRYRLDGQPDGEVRLPGQGTVGIGNVESTAKDFFFGFTNLSTPASIYRHNVAKGSNEVFFEPKLPGYDPAQFETKRVFYQSKDGTKIPMFLLYKRGLKLDGTNPTLLYGYGGFALNSPPYFDSLRLALLEKGFVYASANIRGGAEYGEAWHEQGTKQKKQNVFDDFIAAAEWLIANRYTSSEKLAVHGVSNGGLLVGAVINQRPDLFRAAVPQVGVMDMLRFQKFTAGAGWIGDYGSSDNKEDFQAQYAYSPIHNIRVKAKYPAVLITTADHDDRVVPAHSFKYAATLQEKSSTDRPALIRIATKSGHGASSLGKSIEERADIYCFLLRELGVETGR
jgi:prolyl oligopeptidase